MTTKPESYQPISGNDLPGFAGIATFMRLPYVAPANADEVDIGLMFEIPCLLAEVRAASR